MQYTTQLEIGSSARDSEADYIIQFYELHVKSLKF